MQYHAAPSLLGNTQSDPLAAASGIGHDRSASRDEENTMSAMSLLAACLSLYKVRDHF